MKKAILIGGSSGIGLSLLDNLMQRGYFVYVFGINMPDKNLLRSENFSFKNLDLANLDINEFENLKDDDEIDVLMICSGFGRVAHFSNLSITEIDKLMSVNATSVIKIIRYFYDKMSSKNVFYTGIMGSIAGVISSPLFSVYGASKSALNRFIESVNVELEKNGSCNKILNVSPGSIKGTSFNGEKTSLEMLKDLSNEILDNLFSKNELFIPKYDEIYKSVLNRYNENPKKFGLESYDYKINSNRLCDEKKETIVGYLSGTFDLFHIGHLNLLKRAKEHCDYLIVGIHPSAAHKGKETFIPFEERMQIVGACKYVDKVIPSLPEDNEVWNLHKYHRLFVGSDYEGTERFKRYEKYFEDKGVKIVYFPYTQGTSSTKLREALTKINNKEAK
ncbi:SDR family NAD(P)-dependent oxidoreductase [Campylobacter sp. VBCF_05 NA6]|uniref:SDR family NAD(P)-dependent oxidoreductase n=1 Tax=unclassified Campylobacter TaxID=2593542 RepID=UPI0022E9D210|nr:MULTISPECIES: SDR family NAD(P)-dependent oxidoreductase [unclassified Campylobacter]MDA3057745.1 SDR family NAD(P)-dependent oxidoreductase [Campylobacter sp. VBCF_04 NA7]MDA3058881.1 SDR family NAD(P)-dependent oxidoreductase [Campylobacter sp. VBCF_05 NA6]